MEHEEVVKRARSYRRETVDKHIKEGKFFTVITKSSPVPIIFDQVLRWFAFFAYYRDSVSFKMLLILQLLLIPIAVGVFIYFRTSNVTSKYKGELNLLFISIIPAKLQVILFISFIIISWPIIAFIVTKFTMQSSFILLIQVLAFIIYILYLTAISLFLSPSTKILEIQYTPQYSGSYHCLGVEELEEINNIPIKERERTEAIDNNDINLTYLDTDVISMGNKGETFILESIFIGALAFSGFLTLVSSDKINNSNQIFNTILVDLNNLIFHLYIFDTTYLKSFISDESFIQKEYAFVAIETLICSLFFIIVLATRVRFSSLLDKVKHLISLAKLYNAKEEEIFLLEKQGVQNLAERQLYLNSKIELLLEDAHKAFNNARPLFNYMTIFRSLGIYSFYLILITSGLIFSYSVTLLILCIIVLSLVLRYAITITNVNNINGIIKIYKKDK